MRRPAMIVRRFQLLSLAFVILLLSFGSIGAPCADGPAVSRPPAATTPLREYVRVVQSPYLRVGLTVTAVDRQGRPVRGLARGDFRVLEDGEEMELSDFGPEATRRDRPLSVAVLLDF